VDDQARASTVLTWDRAHDLADKVMQVFADAVKARVPWTEDPWSQACLWLFLQVWLRKRKVLLEKRIPALLLPQTRARKSGPVRSRSQSGTKWGASAKSRARPRAPKRPRGRPRKPKRPHAPRKRGRPEKYAGGRRVGHHRMEGEDYIY
jgi:hypothetical protein